MVFRAIWTMGTASPLVEQAMAVHLHAAVARFSNIKLNESNKYLIFIFECQWRSEMERRKEESGVWKPKMTVAFWYAKFNICLPEGRRTVGSVPDCTYKYI